MYSLDPLIDTYRRNPIDLLGIGDADGELAYLCDHKRSFERTIHDIQAHVPRCGAVLELGCFLGIVSVALSQLGYTVSASDLPQFVQSERLRALLSQNNVRLAGLDLSNHETLLTLYKPKSFDAVVMCETLEHLNFNPLPLLGAIRELLSDKGLLYIAMPNQASLRNRLKLLLGRSIHNPISDYVAQSDPTKNMAAGLHWREYTMNETVEMLRETGFNNVVQSYFFSESSRGWIYSLLPSSFKPTQVVISRSS